MVAPTTSEGQRQERWLLPLVAVVALACHLPVLDRGFALFDEGYFLALANEVLHGRVIYRDVYLDAPLPGGVYLMAAWLRVGGATVWHSRLFVLAIATLLIVLCARIARPLVTVGWTLALAACLVCYRVWAFPHWQLAHYATTSAFFVTVGVALVSQWLGRARATTLVAAGMACGMGIASKQDYGVAVTGMLGLVLLLRPWLRPGTTRAAPALLFTTGVALVLGPGLAYFAWYGALGHLVNQAFLIPVRLVTSSLYPSLPPLRPLFGQDPVLRAGIVAYIPGILGALRWGQIYTSWWWRATPVWDVALKACFYLPFVVLLLAVASWGPRLLRRARRGTADVDDERRLVLLAWTAGFLLAFNRPRDWVHLAMVYPPVLVTGVVLLAGAAARIPPVARRTLVAATVVALGAFVGYTAGLVRDMRRTFAWPLASPRAGVRVDPHNGPIVDAVVDWVGRTATPGAPVPVWPTQPMIGFLADREPAGGFLLVWPSQEADRDDRIIADLEARHVDTVVYSLSQIGALRSLPENAPRLFAHLVANFEVAAVFAPEPSGTMMLGLRRRVPVADAVGEFPVPGDAGFVRARWPFEQVLAQPAGDAPRPVRLRVHVPAAATALTFRYGVEPTHWGNPGLGPMVFRIALDDAPAFEASLDPARAMGDRRWASGRIDASALADRDVTVEFAIVGPEGGPGPVAGWADLAWRGTPADAGRADTPGPRGGRQAPS